MIKKCLLMLQIFLSISYFANAKKVEGFVHDSENNHFINFVNISIKGTTIGTVSNNDGYYALIIPPEHNNGIIAFSFIGYKTKEYSIKSISNNSIVKLEKTDINIKEVLIKADSNLFTLLKSAYRRIPDNYSDEPSILKGFYREAAKEKDSSYLYIAEAIIESYKTSYKNKQEGQVTVLKSRKNIAPNIQTKNNIKFYGGLYSPHNFDFVHGRKGPINPANFQKYSYEFLGIKNYGDLSTYVFSYCTRDSIEYGTFYIDKESLAYIYFENHQLGNWQDLNPNLDRKSRDVKVLYSSINGTWFLKSVLYNSTLNNKKTNTCIELFDDYVTTEVNFSDIKSPRYYYQVDYTDIFSDLATNYDEAFWEDYIILEEDKLNKSQLQLQFNNNESKELLIKDYKESKTTKDKILNFLLKTYYDFELIYSDYNISAPNAHVVINDYVIRNETIPQNITNIGLNFTYGFKLNKKLEFEYRLSQSLLSEITYSANQLGFEYLICIKPGGKQFFALPNISYFNRYSGFYVGELKTQKDFNIGRTTFDSGEVNIYSGKKYQGVAAGINLKTDLAPFLNLIVGCNYYLPITETNYLLFQENKTLWTKKAYQPIDENIEYYEDGLRSHSSSFKLQSWSINAGIRFEF